MGRSFFPNLVTSLNLLCGAIAIVLTAQDELEAGVYFILLAAVFDFLDGFVARLFRASSPLGAQLDSLCDMVSFGLYPGFLLFTLISYSLGLSETPLTDRSGADLFLPLSGFSVSIFAALRLAKFNLSTDQSTSFMGMPTPAMTLTIVFIPLFIASEINGRINLQYPSAGLEASVNSFAFLGKWFINPHILAGMAVLLAFFMVSPFRFIAVKFKKAGIRFYLPVLLLAVPLIILFFVLYYYGYFYLIFFLSMIWYIVLSLILNLIPGMYEVQSRN